MQIIMFIFAAVLFLLPTQAHCFDLLQMLQAAEAGRAARQQAEYMEQQIHNQRLESERIKQETLYLKQLNEQNALQQRLQKEQGITTGLITQIESPKLRSKAYEIYKEFDQEPDLKKRIIAFEELNKILAERLQQQNSLKYFEQNIKPAIVAVHPDFDKIMTDPKQRFFVWAEKQQPDLKKAALHPSSPKEAIWALSEYKKSTAGGAL